MKNSLFIVAILVCVCSNFSDGTDRIQARGKWLVDQSGRVRIFHGFNSVNKGFPWFDPNILNETRLSLYQEWGFNVVRLGIMWAGCEPAEGKLNMTYVNIIEDIVTRLEAHGMYVILDMHQDVLSSKFGSYDGVPRWLVDKFPPSPHLYPWPVGNITEKNWADGYLTEAVSLAFQQIYDNVEDAAVSLSKFWQFVAFLFHKKTSILGYELINEPWAGNIYQHPTLLVPGNAGSKNLEPLYDLLNSVIRKVDNDTLVFYEPVTWAVFGAGSETGSGFRSVPGGEAYQNRSVFSYHYYCWIINPDTTKEHYPTWERLICDDVIGPRVIPTVLKEIDRLGGSAFLTEFGLCAPNGDPQSIDTIECEFTLTQADKYMQSWTYWDSEFFDNLTGEENTDLVRAFARVYPTAVAGEPVSFSFDVDTGEFKFEFQPDAAIKQPTEIFVPKVQYPMGFNVTVSEGLMWKYDEKASVVYVSHAAVKTSQVAFVHIAPVKK